MSEQALSTLFFGFLVLWRGTRGLLREALGIALIGLVVKLSNFGGGEVNIVPHVVCSAVKAMIFDYWLRPCFTHIRLFWYYKQ